MAYTTINKPNLHFNTVTYSGNNTANRSITGVNFQPDFVWIKGRSGTYGAGYNHFLWDSVRGVGKQFYTSDNLAEATNLNNLYSFNNDGFSLGQSSPDAVTNGNSTEFVAWNWKANGSTVSNTQGSITSTVSSNSTNGFSIFTYTGTGASTTTVGHGCSSEPKFVIIKNRSNASGWVTYHYGAGATGLYNPNQASLILNGTNASANPASGGYLSDGYFSNVNSTTLTLRDVNNANNVNANGNNYVGYAFADVKGYSKFGSYVGNGSTDGTFIYTGFKPAFVMAKASSTTGQWSMCDTKRGVAPSGEFLFAEDSGATNSAPANWDFVSNGLKARANYSAHNTSGVTYIYMAFAENPFVSSKGIPTTAR